MITAEYTKKGDGPIKPKDRRNPIGAFDALPEGVVRMIQNTSMAVRSTSPSMTGSRRDATRG